jgi:hypothetical protein
LTINEKQRAATMFAGYGSVMNMVAGASIRDVRKSGVEKMRLAIENNGKQL